MKTKSYNVIIIGSGPAGLFAALRLEKMGMDAIAILDRNPYPAGGLLNDGKLNFDYRVGLDIDELQIDRPTAENMMLEIKRIFTGFPRCRQVTFIDNKKIFRYWRIWPPNTTHSLLHLNSGTGERITAGRWWIICGDI